MHLEQVLVHWPTLPTLHLAGELQLLACPLQRPFLVPSAPTHRTALEKLPHDALISTLVYGTLPAS